MPKFRKLSAAELDGPHLPSAAPFPTGEGEKAVHVPGTSAQPHAPQSAAEIGATTYPRYPAYKDSGVEWLGEVPNHWLTKRFKYLFQLSDERNGTEPVGEMLSVSGYRGVIPKIYEDDNQKRTLEDLAEYRVVHKGQLAINIMWLNYTGLGVSEYEGYVSPAYRVYNIDTSLDKKFLHQVMSQVTQNIYRVYALTLYKYLLKTWSLFVSLYHPSPSSGPSPHSSTARRRGSMRWWRSRRR
jgi:hypothetical protein